MDSHRNDAVIAVVVDVTVGLASPLHQSQPRRRSSRRVSSDNPASASAHSSSNKRRHRHSSRDAVSSDDESSQSEADAYRFEGVAYATYTEMVQAKRQRNQQVLQDSGLLTAWRDDNVMKATATRTTRKPTQPRAGTSAATKQQRDETIGTRTQQRKSSRLQGIQSDGMFVADERGGTFTVSTYDGNSTTNVKGHSVGYSATAAATPNERSNVNVHFNNRINDGQPLTVPDASESSNVNWIRRPDDTEDSDYTNMFVRTILKNAERGSSMKSMQQSDASMSSATLSSAIDNLTIDDTSRVSKVCPERIYSVAMHPSEHKLIVCAGDKTGHIGLWHVPNETTVNSTSADQTQSAGVHLFRPHHSVVCSMQWTPHGDALLSASYDGTVRWFDVQAERFVEIFATYNDDPKFADRLGFGLATGSNVWTQYACLDERFANETCFFLATSVGTAMHVDVRSNERITFHEELSAKKINTLSLHPDGHSLLSAGLDCTVALWDVRKLSDGRTGRGKNAPQPIASYNCGRSVNSAFYSATGRYVVSTSMANTLDVFDNLHLSSGNVVSTTRKPPIAEAAQPMQSIRHDNLTGRWLTTFHAICHPSVDLFGVGSMSKPRCVDFLDLTSAGTGTTNTSMRNVSGDALSSVQSRLAFHPRSDRLVLAGGNSSGRVTVFYE